MLSRVEVTNAQDQVLSLPLINEDTGYVVTDMSGLDPVTANVVTSKYANFDGVQFQAASRDGRNITLQIEYDPDYSTETIQDMRRNLYSWFLPKSNIKLSFKTDRIGINDVVYEIEGVVESMENALFSKDPVVNVSIICPLPDFLDVETLTLEGSSVSDLTEVPLEYTGTTDTGILFTFFPDRALTDFSLNVRRPDGVLQTLSFSDDLENEDVLEINTGFGVKEVTLTRLTLETNLLDKVSATSVWMQLKPGTNQIRVSLTGATIPYMITYRNRYGGL